MEIVIRGNGYLLELQCPVCGSVLLAERDEIRSVCLGDDRYDFNCPVCCEERRITESKIKKIFK